MYSFWDIVFYIRNRILLGLTTKKRYSNVESELIRGATVIAKLPVRAVLRYIRKSVLS